MKTSFKKAMNVFLKSTLNFVLSLKEIFLWEGLSGGLCPDTVPGFPHTLENLENGKINLLAWKSPGKIYK